MSIESNTTALQDLLAMANNLPDATTGTNVQTKSGTVTTNSSGTATASCGFKPDFVAFDGGTVPSGSSAGTKVFVGAAFTAGNVTKSSVTITPSNGNTHIQTILAVSQTSTGFSISAKNLSAAFEESNCTSRTLSYVAVKYT